MSLVSTGGRLVNKLVLPLVRRFARWPAATGGFGLAVVAYRGHRSGRDFRLVAGIRRSEDGVVITVELPDRKRWWRNFLQRRPIAIEVAGTRRTGRALATRDDDGRVRVHVHLD